jgi:hypothetical protein
MQFHQANNWFHAAEFPRAAQAVHDACRTMNYMAADLWRCKYVQLYIDQRTGDFIFRDGDGQVLTHDEVYRLYPSLKDDVVLVSAGVRPYPE